MTEEINQDDHEKLRHTITFKPDSVSTDLNDATDIEWYLTDDRQQGVGQELIKKTQSNGEVTVVDATTFDVELEPSETRGLPVQRLWAEATFIFAGDPTTVSLEPEIKVRETMYDST